MTFSTAVDESLHLPSPAGCSQVDGCFKNQGRGLRGHSSFPLSRRPLTDVHSGMPRTGRASVGGICYHVINRGNAQNEIFHKSGDYQTFVELIGLACARIPMRVLAYCVMPNHFHLSLWPYSDRDLGHWIQWLLTTHVRRYHQHHRSNGHVWQGRFKAFPIEQDDHLLTVLRYIERNPLRAGLVQKAEDWHWSSLHHWKSIPRGRRN